MPFDLILRGGRVIDPSQKLDAVTDVAFAGGKVAAIGPRLTADPTTDVRDVSGLIVSPGIIDLHTHVYWGGTSLGIDAEEFCRASGVTTAVAITLRVTTQETSSDVAASAPCSCGRTTFTMVNVTA